MERSGNYVINSYLKTIIRLYVSMSEDPLVKEVVYLINGSSLMLIWTIISLLVCGYFDPKHRLSNFKLNFLNVLAVGRFF